MIHWQGKALRSPAVAWLVYTRDSSIDLHMGTYLLSLRRFIFVLIQLTMLLTVSWLYLI